MKWGVRSMVWYVFILFIAMFFSLHFYSALIHEPEIQRIFF